MKINRLCILIVVIFLIFYGCNDTNVKKYYYDSGEILSEVEVNQDGYKNGSLKEYFKSGELRAIEYYSNGKIIDTSKRFFKSGELSIREYMSDTGNIYERFYKNGNPMSIGKINDTTLWGWWNYYDEKGKLKTKIDYVDASNDVRINKKQYANQIIRFDKNRNIIKDSSNYFVIELRDTILLNKLTLGTIDLTPQLSRANNFHTIHFWHEDMKGNILEVDSTYGTNTKKADFWLTPKELGHYKFKGYILEKGTEYRTNKNDTSMVDVVRVSKTLFFEKQFYVKDTLINGNKSV